MLVVHLLTGHCYLGRFPIPWDRLDSVSCPLCGGEFPREYLLWDCIPVSKQREEFLSHRLDVRGKHSGSFANLGLDSLSQFLLPIGQPFGWRMWREFLVAESSYHMVALVFLVTVLLDYLANFWPSSQRGVCVCLFVCLNQ